MRLILTLTCLLATSTAAAETCKYVDKEGRVTYSNVPIKGAKKVTVELTRRGKPVTIRYSLK